MLPPKNYSKSTPSLEAAVQLRHASSAASDHQSQNGKSSKWKNSLDNLDGIQRGYTVVHSAPVQSAAGPPAIWNGNHATSHSHSNSDSGLSSLSGRASTMSPISTMSTVSSVSSASSSGSSSRASLRSASIVSSCTIPLGLL